MKKKSVRAIFRNEKETLQRTGSYEGLNKDIIFDLQVFGYSEGYNEMWIKINKRKVFETKDLKKFMERRKSDDKRKGVLE